MGLRFGKRRATKEAPVLLEAAQAGDGEARNQLIHDFTPFVLKVSSQAAGRFLRPGMDEEISVALMAFNEAIDAYDPSKGAFLSFAQTVIRRRLVDYFRRERNRQYEVTLSEIEDGDEEGQAISVVDKLAHSAWFLVVDQENRRLEIEEFQHLIARYGITLMDLSRLSPKHRDARDRAIHIGRMIVKNPCYRQHLLERQELPLKDLVREPGISRKTIERHRKYIIAVAMILLHDLPYLQGYLLER